MKPQVLVTGPGDGSAVVSALAELELTSVCVPMLRTQQVQMGDELLQRVRRSLQRADALVVSSPRAATALVEIIGLLRQQGLDDLPDQILAVGAATQAVLRQADLPGRAPGAGEGVEALLADGGQLGEKQGGEKQGGEKSLSALLPGAQVVVFAGYAARPLLKLRLSQAGLCVEEFKVYRRLPPLFNPGQRQQLAEALQVCRLAVITSATALRFLLALAVQLGHEGTLPPLLTVSERLVAIAAALGCPQACSAGDSSAAQLAHSARQLLHKEAEA